MNWHKSLDRNGQAPYWREQAQGLTARLALEMNRR